MIIRTFLTALLERDAARTVSWLQQQKHFGAKASEAIVHLTPLFAAHFSSNVIFELITVAFQRVNDDWARQWSLQTLARQFDDVRVWQLIHNAATKDTSQWVRRMACDLLIASLNCSELQRKLMRQDLDRYWPWYDLKEPITSARVTEAARRLNLSVDEVRQQYEVIAAQLPVELILEWRKGP